MRHLLIATALSIFVNTAAFATQETLTTNSKSLTAEASDSKAAGQAADKLLVDCGSLTAQTLSYVCGRINDVNIRLQCLAAGRDAYLDQCALGACDRYTDANTTVGCVNAIANRAYTLEEVLTCDSIPDANQTTQCFAISGRYVGGGNGSVDIREVRYRVSVALNLLRNGNSLRAEEELTRLLDYLGRN